MQCGRHGHLKDLNWSLSGEQVRVALEHVAATTPTHEGMSACSCVHRGSSKLVRSSCTHLGTAWRGTPTATPRAPRRARERRSSLEISLSLSLSIFLSRERGTCCYECLQLRAQRFLRTGLVWFVEELHA